MLANNANALIVRTAWLYGPNGNSFPRTMIRAFNRGSSAGGSDQVGCPTYTADLARVLVDLAEKNAFPGIYHAVGPESMSWHEFALRTIAAWSKRHEWEAHPTEIEPIRTEDWPTPAKRPKYSVLSTAKITSLDIAAMRPVDESLQDFCVRFVL